ncbi:protein EXECUTER 1, chloroplastic isoform X2 [Elaeis guineensis]|uniref:Protein EXECUTER 1, chloroplastic isoform X2 n=1 Tax=Elaeis guineensis var. tenera TaxID=51953 RepID=A0A6I9SHL2_ELAGV|nr:protein EXECUTER 1, chloroplastic isoform X2 [Elaeis guineensis]
MTSIPTPRFPPSSAHATDPNPHKFPSKPSRFLRAPPPVALSSFKKASTSASRAFDSGPCRCLNRQSDSPSPDGDSGRRRWDSLLHDVVRSAVKRWDDYVSSYWNSSPKNDPRTNVPAGKGEEKEAEGKDEGKKWEKEGDWDWERWKRHFAEVEEQHRLVFALKSQLTDAIIREDYKEAMKLKLAIAAATQKDTVGTAISDMNRAIEEERYADAAHIRDHAGAGLLGWWAGFSEDGADPYGRIIRISAEHGRYVARSYSSRQLATARPGFPLFEIFFTVINGEYKQQAVYLKENGDYSGGLHKYEIKNEISSLNPSDTSADGQNGIYNEDIESLEKRDDDSDVTDELSSIQNILRDIIPGVKVRVLKVVAPGRVDRDLIAKVIEEIIEEEDDENDEELDRLEPEDIKSDSDMEETEMNAGDVPNDFSEEKSTMPVKIVIEGLMQNLHADVPPENLVRMPARLEKKNHISFSFVPEHDEREFVNNKKGQASGKNVAPRSSQLSATLVMSDLAKVIFSKEKVLRDIGELISFAANRAQNHQPLLSPTLFNRIEIPATSDPLTGLYVGAHGMYTSEILYLKRKFGQWQEDAAIQKQGNLEFYEYVEAIKLTGDHSVPAGQVAFRAKIGKRYQLPHKGIIPEEFGVVARYKGQGRLADPGFRNPQWVDGELVILDGKYIRGGPVIGFVYWTSGYNILLFFNRLKLPD